VAAHPAGEWTGGFWGIGANLSCRSILLVLVLVVVLGFAGFFEDENENEEEDEAESGCKLTPMGPWGERWGEHPIDTN